MKSKRKRNDLLRHYKIKLVSVAIGFLPIPFLNVVWAPLSAYLMTKIYKGKEGKIASIITFIEEALPLDILPTFTIMWLYFYVIKKEKTDKIIAL